MDNLGQYKCMEESCNKSGEFKAPKNKEELRNYIWFCLDHIRIYNKEWNFYSGVEGEELNQKIKNGMTWERPSWKFGLNSFTNINLQKNIDDIFGFYKNSAFSENNKTDKDPEKDNAWKIFGIPNTSTKEQIKKRYNQLAKKFHPDHNKNNPKAEEFFKEINLAYSILSNSVCKKTSSINH